MKKRLFLIALLLALIAPWGVVEGQVIAGARHRAWQNVGAPSSGTSGTFANSAVAGALLWDTSNGVLFVNEGTIASPYWTPTSFDQRALFGVHTDFRDQAGKVISDTVAEAIIPGSGLRIFGQGIAETDSGLVAQTATEGGIVARITTTDEISHLLAIGMDAGVMQPDQHQLLVVDVTLTNVSAITLRSMFVGFVGTAVDALDVVILGQLSAITLFQDDLAGVGFDASMTDPDRLWGVHNKSDEAATQDVTADGDTSTDIAAAATEQRIRVEITAAGAMTVFVDKVQVYTFATALDANEEVSPVFYLASTSTATKSADVRQFSAWAYR